MKQFIPALIFMLLAGKTVAQYVPNNGQAFQVISQYNPAFTGVESFGDIKLSYRYQWTGFGSNAPSFVNLSFNGRLRQPLDLTSNALRTSNAAKLAPEKMPKSKGIIHGLGGFVFKDVIGQVERMGGGINYAFNYPLSPKIRLSTGVSVIADNVKVDLSKITLRDPDEYYNNLVSNGSSQTDLSVRAGFLVYGKQFYFGGSYLPVWHSLIQSADIAVYEPLYIASAQAGVSFPVSQSFIVKPSVLSLVGKNGDLQFDYSVKGYLQDKAWAGLTYRDTKYGIMMAGFNVSDSFTVSYSYEISLSGFGKFSDGSHELVAALRINNYKRQNQYTW